VEASDPILGVLTKIPTFAGLALPEIQKIFGICRLTQLASGSILYKSGSPSADMFILLEGSLGVRTSAGVEVSRIYPIGLVGEMGTLTGEPRSADVAALEDVMGFSIHKDDLTGLLSRNSDICHTILINVIQNLSKKLYNSNLQMEQLKKSVPDLNKEAEEFLSGNIFLY
jgi:CRP-like cAMP-binding protein